MLSAEQAALQEAKEHPFHAHSVPAHVHETRPLDTHVRSEPRRPSEVCVYACVHK